MKRERGTVGLHAAGPGAITSMFVGVANEKEVFEYVHTKQVFGFLRTR